MEESVPVRSAARPPPETGVQVPQGYRLWSQAVMVVNLIPPAWGPLSATGGVTGQRLFLCSFSSSTAGSLKSALSGTFLNDQLVWKRGSLRLVAPT